MRTRHGDWRDLLSAYSLAFGRKMWLGFLGVGATIIIVFVAAGVYDHFASEEVGLLLSKKTRECIDDFVGDYLGMDPELADTPLDTPLLMF